MDEQWPVFELIERIKYINQRIGRGRYEHLLERTGTDILCAMCVVRCIVPHLIPDPEKKPYEKGCRRPIDEKTYSFFGHGHGGCQVRHLLRKGGRGHREGMQLREGLSQRLHRRNGRMSVL